jgi:hypothetical protein
MDTGFCRYGTHLILRFLFKLDRIRAQFNGASSHFITGFSKKSGIRSADVKHLHALRLDPYFSKEFFSLIYFFLGSQISFQEMAIALLSASGENGIRAVFKGFQKVQRIQFARAHQLNDTDTGGILDTHRACQVGCRIGTIMAAESDHLGLVSLFHL